MATATVTCHLQTRNNRALTGWFIKKTIEWKFPFRLKKGDEVFFSSWDLEVVKMDMFDPEMGTCGLTIFARTMAQIADLVKNHDWKVVDIEDSGDFEKALKLWQESQKEQA